MRARLPRLPLMFRLCVVALLLFGVSQAASACPTCKAGLGAHDPTHGDLVGAYMWSILFMMAMPFTTLALLSGYMYLLVRKARQSAATASQQTQPAVAGLANDASPAMRMSIEEEAGAEPVHI